MSEPPTELRVNNVGLELYELAGPVEMRIVLLKISEYLVTELLHESGNCAVL